MLSSWGITFEGVDVEATPDRLADLKKFGIPRVPNAHMPEIRPRDAVSRFWPATRRKLADAEPMSWPLHLAMAAHTLIVDLKDAVRPDIAVRIVMESAVPMSKIDPVTLPKE